VSGSSRRAGLEILQCIPAVKIFAFLDLGKNFSFSDSLIVGQFRSEMGGSGWEAEWEKCLDRENG